VLGGILVPLSESLNVSLAAAGQAMTAYALATAVLAPALIILTCDQAGLAAGESRSFFVLTLARAVLVVAGLWIGLQLGGLPGALIGQGLANIAAYPVLVWLVRRHGAWDPLHDAVFTVIGIGYAVLAVWLNWDAVAALALIPSG